MTRQIHQKYKSKIIRVPWILISTILVALCLVVAGCEQLKLTPLVYSNSPSLVANISLDRLAKANSEPQFWLTGGRDYQQSYNSPLKDINRSNIHDLGFAWQYEIDTTHGFEATPIVVDGVMYSSGPFGAVYALDAKTGLSRWNFEPDIDPGILKFDSSGTKANRGVAVWNGIVYVGSFDGYLYALDADTGTVIWKVDTITDRTRGYTISGAPYIANNKVVIGNSGGDIDARGYVTAYDVKTGVQQWRFFIVPGDPKKGFEHPELEMAIKTWDPDSLWEAGLGGTVWDGMAYDPTLDLLYVGTGNGVPHARKLRSPKGGDNLFLSCILAINPNTGELVWHYQTTPADNWDYTATQKMILAELEIDGVNRDVIMQAPKNGFFYVLDRITGELLSAEPYVYINWASHIDMATGRPVETGQGDYSHETKMIFPSPYGGHNWQPMSYSSVTGLVYIPTMTRASIATKPDESFLVQKGGWNFATQYEFPLKKGVTEGIMDGHIPPLDILAEGQPDYTVRSLLKAWDPIKQRMIWEVDTSGQWAGSIFGAWNGGGVMTTAGGLIFQGRGSGKLMVLDANTGEQLHAVDVGTGISAAPMSYRIDGEQYIAVMAGVGGILGTSPPEGSASYKYGNKGRIVAFKLGGGVVPARKEIARKMADFPIPSFERRGTPEQVEIGRQLFQRNCTACHKNSGGGGIPDLRTMNKSTHLAFKDIVLQGGRIEQGMPMFEGILDEEDVASIHTYLIDLAWRSFSEDKH